MSRALAFLPLIAVAFVAGWWWGRRSAVEGDGAERAARLERQLEDLTHLVRSSLVLAGQDAGTEPIAVDPAAVPSVAEQPATAGSPAQGPVDAPVTVVVFSDFQCPYCATVPPLLHKLLEEFRGKVRVVFKHYPLPNHLQALAAHGAAAAAAEQGKFWEFHDVLFANQDRFDPESLREYARLVGLNLEQFGESLESLDAAEVIALDRKEARRVGVQAVPAFFVNGRQLAGSKPYEVLRSLVAAELARKEGGG